MKQVPSGKGRRLHKQKTEHTNWVENKSEDSDSDHPVHKIAAHSTHPITVTLEIQGKPVASYAWKLIQGLTAVLFICEET